MTRRDNDPGQLGFDDLLADAATENTARKFERETAHLPGTMDEALGYFRGLLDRHHAAMLAADIDEAMRLREEADLLALKLNGGEPGILAHEDAPGRALERETAASPETVPLWGQKGEFTIALSGMRVHIEMEGVFGIGSGFGYWPGFAARAVDVHRPFLSETGYRSFLGIHADPVPGMTPDSFAAKIIAAYAERDLKGKLLAIDPRWCRKAGS